jgi:hypothetical protein
MSPGAKTSVTGRSSSPAGLPGDQCHSDSIDDRWHIVVGWPGDDRRSARNVTGALTATTSPNCSGSGSNPPRIRLHEEQELLSVAYSYHQRVARRHGGRRRHLRRWDAQPATPAVSDVIQAIGL